MGAIIGKDCCFHSVTRKDTAGGERVTVIKRERGQEEREMR